MKGITAMNEELQEIIAEFTEEFAAKQQDYEGTRNFGVLGQYMKIANKVDKLNRTMYEGEIYSRAKEWFPDEFKKASNVDFSLNFEGTEEILRDIAGHCFLALAMYRAEQNASEG
ncbi:hypothetical protein SEA_LITTLEFELLA_66 [Gordonia phage LittleFella]|nr:hypothetical protein SEA_LITTLEFELLA_66 [Gordonia phage LittleFella]